MNILLCPNLNKDNGLICTQKTVEKLLELGANPMLDQKFREPVGEIGCKYGRFPALLTSCDILMPVGGDGTIMRAAKHAVTADKPVLAVNAGRLGFLTQMELDELENLRLLTDGRYTTFRRMMLEAELIQGGKPRKFSALNDVVVRGDTVQTIDVEIQRQELLIARHRADGLILATPTGSTAYSLSAGGPIVDPRMTMLLMTAICPHSTFSRTVILPTDQEYAITNASQNSDKGLYISVDGRKVGKIQNGETVIVRKSAASVRFIDLGLRSFYTSVNEKLSWGR